MGGLPVRSTIIGSSVRSVRGRGLRRNGAAGLDLAWLAAGRFDFYWEYDLSRWDESGGILLVREAGGR